MHPHKPGNTQSNRTPTLTEIEKGRPALNLLVAVFPLAQVVAVGKKAEGLLNSMGITTAATLRHPANGGATQFAEGLRQLVKNRNR
jgi:uracil-DNA glycosylase